MSPFWTCACTGCIQKLTANDLLRNYFRFFKIMIFLSSVVWNFNQISLYVFCSSYALHMVLTAYICLQHFRAVVITLLPVGDFCERFIWRLIVKVKFRCEIPGKRRKRLIFMSAPFNVGNFDCVVARFCIPKNFEKLRTFSPVLLLRLNFIVFFCRGGREGKGGRR